MYVLGISFNCYNPSACLLKDNNIVAFIEEERLNRIKNASNFFPIQSIKSCLDEGNIEINDIAYIAYGFDVTNYDNGNMKVFYDSIEFEKDDKTIKWENYNIQLFSDLNIKEIITQNFIRAGITCPIPPIKYYPHHLCHAASSFYCSEFDKAIAITIDGSGDDNCTVLWECDGEKIKEIEAIKLPNSLGWLYASITEYLGFRANNGEGKVMGLAPYGKKVEEIEDAFDTFMQIDGKNYFVDPSFIFYGKHSYNNRYTDKMVSTMPIHPKKNKDNLFSGYENIAFTLQNRLEKSLVNLTNYLIENTKIKNLCLAGGVALNCKANGKIWELCDLNNIFIQPISSDAGLSLGAALLCLKENGIKPGIKFDNLYLGPKFTNEEIEAVLQINKLEYEKLSNIEHRTAELICDGNIVGWFQGRMEAGPRALGARSILADPRKFEMKDKINKKVKFRDEWRPFCPSILADRADKYFASSYFHPFMILAFQVRKSKLQTIPAVVHIDGTSRPQMVTSQNNHKF